MADWLAPGAHVNTLGPKFKSAHELPATVAERVAVVATDPLVQVKGYADARQPFFLAGADRERMVELADLLVEQADHSGASDESPTLA